MTQTTTTCKVISTSDYIVVPVTDQIFTEATERDNANFLRHGMTKTEGPEDLDHRARKRRAGYIGEVAIKHSLPFLMYSNTDKYDFSNFIEERYDAKNACQHRMPAVNYTCCFLPNYKEYETDYFIFTATDYKLTKCWILGFITPADFIANSILKKKGEPKEHGTVYLSDRREMKVNQLNVIRNLWMQ